MSVFSKYLGRPQALPVYAGLALVIAVMVAGCGAGYRPVVTPINPSGPAPQPASLAAVVSSPSPTSPGIATIINYSGDTIMATAPIGVGPITFTLDETGSTGYTVNSDGTITNFPASNNLQQKNVTFSTLPSTAVPVNLFSPSSGLWMADLDGNVIDVLELEESESGQQMTLLIYKYDVAGVTYEASQDVTHLRQFIDLYSCRLGLLASVKYDPHNPGDSVVISETWSGLRKPAIKMPARAETQPSTFA